MNEADGEDPTSQGVNNWIQFADAAKEAIAVRYGRDLDDDGFNVIAKDAFKVDCLTHMITRPLPNIEDFLAAIDTSLLRDVFIEEVELEESILRPEDMRLILEETIKAGGEIWRIHKNDADPFPSSPHAHHQGSDLKMDLSNGNVYRGKKWQYAVSRKDLENIRSKVKKINLPDLKLN